MTRLQKISSLFLLCFAGLSMAQCPPSNFSQKDSEKLIANKFQVKDVALRNNLAIELLACIESTDPYWRDTIAFTSNSIWLRSNLLSNETVQAMRIQLLADIENSDDFDGFRRPFAALLLSEVARVDRIKETFSAEEFNALIAPTANYMASISDYRGFDEKTGWRHAVAHSSDLVLQLSINPRIDAEQQKQLLDALATQIAPASNVFYQYGEPERLQRAVYYAYQTHKLDDTYWQQWFERISSPAPLENWGSAFTTQAGLAKRHNTLNFLFALCAIAYSDKNEKSASLTTFCDASFKRINGG